MLNPILKEDLHSILNSLSKEQRDIFSESTILITGCAGFLGFYFMHFFAYFHQELKISNVIALDNFMLRTPKWLNDLKIQYPALIKVNKFDIIKDKIESLENSKQANLIIHLASIASPVFYRQYPIETLDANIWGLRNLLEFYKDKPIKGLLFFSSSEIYGDPSPDQIPTDEDYRGNVACIGPRACYDESKRFGETLCYLFAQKYSMPITIARPFNNYGPGMNPEDKRVPADFAKAILQNKNIEILSDGSPKRTFCYISDALSGYIKTLAYQKFDYFNIGTDTPEISIKELALIYKNAGEKLLNYNQNIIFETPSDKEYLTHNPNRRSPIIKKAKELLSYEPKILVEEGVERFLKFLILEKEEK
ncbi:epimerase [Helicobacter sp. 12S02232-10]|uniref:NAD-dependent epimerase/dehydratase family protein n=1 Tax=Helicobacter sp. 12S02232-10 TaxID=1476197 RepID=UPI000BA6F05C|nr:NAD-dependent epimerase/dehydratase family protein [Helicobacter sp. 12S02232-10]PAF48850.1 epimerase [Helicobacter sp. 12S02232-10]